MEYKNSYIFLKRKKEQKQKTSSGNKIIIDRSTSFDELFQKSFSNVSFSNKNSVGDYIKTGKIIFHKKTSESKAKFDYYKVGDNYYLNIIVKETKNCEDEAVKMLSRINEKLIGAQSVINEEYIHIITDDHVSEYYCNKLYPYFNLFDRKLRKILIYVYTLNFELDYYQSTFDKKFVESLKIGSSQINKELSEWKNKNTKKNDEDVQYAFYALEYNDIENILFEEKITEYDTNKLKKFLEKNDNLSNLKDEKLRDAYKQCLPRSDWERFFKGKKIVSNFKELFNEIHKYRNDVMHCKIITYNRYKDCFADLKEGIKSLNLAIEYIEHEDFQHKNILSRIETVERMSEIIGNALLKAAESIVKMQKVLYPVIDDIIGNERNVLASVAETLAKSNIAGMPTNICNGIMNGITDSLKDNGNIQNDDSSK